MDSKNKKIDYWTWVKELPIFFIVVMLFQYFVWSDYKLYDYFYLNGLFQWLRVIYDYTFGFLPIPSVYIVFVLLILGLSKFFKAFESSNWRKSVFKIIRYLSFPFALFYLLWGTNYKDIGLTERLSLKNRDIDEMYLREEIKNVLSMAVAYRPVIFDYPTFTEDTVRMVQEKLLSSWGIPVRGRVRVRLLYPEGILLRFSTAGIYIPYAMEGHIDAGLHPITWPSTMAHEMAHGYGITDEGTCNFISYLTCIDTNVAEIQYSGSIMYLRYLLSNYRRYYSDCYHEIIDGMSPGIKQDLNAISEQHNKFPDLMPKTRDKVYDYYLKSNGVKEGLKSYSKIIEMVAAWKSSEYYLDGANFKEGEN